MRLYKDGTRIGHFIFVLVTPCASNLRISALVILRSSQFESCRLRHSFQALAANPEKDLVPVGSVCKKLQFLSSSSPANVPPQELSVPRLFASDHGEPRCCGDRLQSGIKHRRVAEVVAS